MKGHSQSSTRWHVAREECTGWQWWNKGSCEHILRSASSRLCGDPRVCSCASVSVINQSVNLNDIEIMTRHT